MPTRSRFPLPRIIALALVLLPLGPALGATAPGAVSSGPEAPELCRLASQRVERAERIPAGLLRAIGRVESGRWVKAVGTSVAWPWTVYAEGRGRYLPSKLAAIREVERLRARGIANIDVGCMQVNLGYHPDAFERLERAFDPATNTAYAGRFLAALKRETRTWSKAISHYHSRTPQFAVPYAAKVRAMWNRVRREAAEERRQAGQHKWRVRLQARAAAGRANRRALWRIRR